MPAPRSARARLHALVALAFLPLPLLLVAVGASPAGAAPSGSAGAPPPVRHVWVIVLENKDYDQTWGPSSPAPYLAGTLRREGKLLSQYHGTGHLSLDNYLTMISGQPPNPQTQADCQRFTDFIGPVGADGIAVGEGCVYPAAVQTLPDQLEAAGLTWKGYLQDMGDDPVRDNGTTCAHPPIGPTSSDPTQTATAADQYATRHNPFVYFHSIIDEPTCAANVVPLTRLTTDLASTETTPSFSFITPDLCNDAHDEPCVTGEPGGLVQADSFLQEWVPKILASPAYADNGLVLVTFDEAEDDASACCEEPTGPNTPVPGIYGPGGGRIGMLAISPFITPGTTSEVPYNHYSFLRSMEDLFGVAHLGYAGQDGLAAFGSDVYDRVPMPTKETAASSPTPLPAPSPPSALVTLPVTGASAQLGLIALLAAVALTGRRWSR